MSITHSTAQAVKSVIRDAQDALDNRRVALGPIAVSQSTGA